MKNDGWSVYRDTRTDAYVLSKGSRDVLTQHGFVFMGWTAGTKKDGQALLAELRVKESV